MNTAKALRSPGQGNTNNPNITTNRSAKRLTDFAAQGMNGIPDCPAAEVLRGALWLTARRLLPPFISLFKQLAQLCRGAGHAGGVREERRVHDTHAAQSIIDTRMNRAGQTSKWAVSNHDAWLRPAQ